ncbi:MAG: hypothetical protein Q4C98_04185 [Capnocytophaga sp.]|nr:hypothetical protein [Capnocytophaga sp.]
MKNLTILALFQALSSVISSILISNMSFVGRIGISTAYRQYLIFKVWWKTALVLFAIQLIIILVLFFSKKIGKIIPILLFVAGILGTYFTYIDFTTTSHKMMKIEFHSGFYLFWASWLISCLYFLFLRKYKTTDNKLIIDENIKSQQENFVQNKNQ